jgi:hypothetical protein
VGILDVTCGSRPVAGRPRRFFGVTFIDLFMILGVTQKQAERIVATFRRDARRAREGRACDRNCHRALSSKRHLRYWVDRQVTMENEARARAYFERHVA